MAIGLHPFRGYFVDNRAIIRQPVCAACEASLGGLEMAVYVPQFQDNHETAVYTLLEILWTTLEIWSFLCVCLPMKWRSTWCVSEVSKPQAASSIKNCKKGEWLVVVGM